MNIKEIEFFRDKDIIQVCIGHHNVEVTYCHYLFLSSNGMVYWMGIIMGSHYSSDLFIQIPITVRPFIKRDLNIKRICTAFSNNWALDDKGNIYAFDEPFSVRKKKEYTDRCKGKIIDIKCNGCHIYVKTDNDKHYVFEGRDELLNTNKLLANKNIKSAELGLWSTVIVVSDT